MRWSHVASTSVTVVGTSALAPQQLFRISFRDSTIMQPQTPQRANLLQSRRFLTHQPTFEPAPTQVLGGLELKQEDEVNIVRPPLVRAFVFHLATRLTLSYQVSQQPMISGDVPEGSALNPGLAGRFAMIVIRLGCLPRHSLNATLGLIH